MPYDDLPIHSDTEWKLTIEEMSVVMKEMVEAIVKLRAEIAPLVDRHREEERQRRIPPLANQYTNQLHSQCDCTPSRAQAISGFGISRLT